MWGQVPAVRLLSAMYRIIPMRVGTRTAGISNGRIKPGSSPCVWGQGINSISKHRKVRIIPMRVGTSFYTCSMHLKAQDHPHACGDKKGCCLCGERHLGSSPCVWGQDACISPAPISDRIIPMRVGTSCRANVTHSIVKDHPHACGDK